MKDYILEHKGLIAFTLFLSIISSLLYVFVAIILQKILDTALSGNLSAFGNVVIFATLYFLVMGLLLYFHSRLSKGLICKIVRSMRYCTFQGIISHRIEDFNKNNTGDYISAVNNDVKLVEDNYLIPILDMFQYIIMFIASLAVMIYYDVIITLCVIGSMLLMFLIPLIFGKIMEKRQDAYSQKLAEFTAHLKDLFLGFEVIQSYRMKSYVLGRFKKSNDETIDAKYNVNRVEAANDAVSLLLAVFVQVVVIFLAAYFIILGRLTPGMLLGMVQISATLSTPLIIIFQSLPLIKSAKPIIERLNSYRDYKADTFLGEENPSFSKNLLTKNLSFSYQDDIKVLKDINLEFTAGKKYALVGKSGCGKSTLVKVLTGYYSQYEGDVFYDGKDIKVLDYEALNELSTTIHQNVYMFDETIADNICLHRDYDEKFLDKALKDSGVAGFLPQIKDGLSSEVGENGANLSGGQKQRIAVARAIVREKPILILDEGTSAIDMQTAYDIENELLKIEGLTLITITHNMREDALERYDEIIYMEDGAAKEQGHFHDLIEKKAGFYGLYTLDR